MDNQLATSIELRHDSSKGAVCFQGATIAEAPLWIPYDDQGCSLVTFVREVLVTSGVACEVLDFSRSRRGETINDWRVTYVPLPRK